MMMSCSNQNETFHEKTRDFLNENSRYISRYFALDAIMLYSKIKQPILYYYLMLTYFFYTYRYSSSVLFSMLLSIAAYLTNSSLICLFLFPNFRGFNRCCTVFTDSSKESYNFEMLVGSKSEMVASSQAWAHDRKGSIWFSHLLLLQGRVPTNRSLVL